MTPPPPLAPRAFYGTQQSQLSQSVGPPSMGIGMGGMGGGGGQRSSYPDQLGYNYQQQQPYQQHPMMGSAGQKGVYERKGETRRRERSP